MSEEIPVYDRRLDKDSVKPTGKVLSTYIDEDGNTIAELQIHMPNPAYNLYGAWNLDLIPQRVTATAGEDILAGAFVTVDETGIARMARRTADDPKA
jgi:hypothetical protein